MSNAFAVPKCYCNHRLKTMGQWLSFRWVESLFQGFSVQGSSGNYIVEELSNLEKHLKTQNCDERKTIPQKGWQKLFCYSYSFIFSSTFSLFCSRTNTRWEGRRQEIFERGNGYVCCNPKFWRRQWHPTPLLLPGKSHGWRSLVGCSPWGREESDKTERLHFHFSLSCIGEGNGNPLQCSCLENPRDGGARWAAVYGVSQSRPRLKRLSSSVFSWLVTQWHHLNLPPKFKFTRREVYSGATKQS